MRPRFTWRLNAKLFKARGMGRFGWVTQFALNHFLYDQQPRQRYP